MLKSFPVSHINTHIYTHILDRNDECVHDASNTDIKSVCDGNATCSISSEAFSTYECPSSVAKYFQGEYKCVQNLYNEGEICQREYPG